MMDVVPPGYRFVPIAKEVIEDYLINIDQEKPLPSRAVVKKEIYGPSSSSTPPWEVISMDDPSWMPVVSDEDSNKRVIYVYTEIKYLNDKTKNHVNRRSGPGTWEGKAKAKKITNKKKELIGYKKSFTYKPDKDIDISKYGKWTMHEYSLASGVYKPKSNYVVCKITIDQTSIIHQDHQDEEIEIINHQHPNKKLKVGNIFIDDHDDVNRNINNIDINVSQPQQQEEGYNLPPPPTLINLQHHHQSYSHGFDDQLMMIQVLAETSNPNPTSSALAVDDESSFQVPLLPYSTTSPNQLEQINDRLMPEFDDLPKVDNINGAWEQSSASGSRDHAIHFEEENNNDVENNTVPESTVCTEDNLEQLSADLGTMMPPSGAMSVFDESFSMVTFGVSAAASSSMSPNQFEQQNDMMMLQEEVYNPPPPPPTLINHHQPYPNGFDDQLTGLPDDESSFQVLPLMPSSSSSSTTSPNHLDHQQINHMLMLEYLDNLPKVGSISGIWEPTSTSGSRDHFEEESNINDADNNIVPVESTVCTEDNLQQLSADLGTMMPPLTLDESSSMINFGVPVAASSMSLNHFEQQNDMMMLQEENVAKEFGNDINGTTYDAMYDDIHMLNNCAYGVRDDDGGGYVDLGPLWNY